MDLCVGRTRTAMSYSQRLRGEVIALGMSYIGLYSAIEQLRGVTDAFMQIEAAQNRMLVAFNGNEAISQREMRWVREEADRLGIQLDRKSTRLNSSHVAISYAVFCLKKQTNTSGLY